MKLPLKKRKSHRFGIAWKESSPFIDNSRAMLVHRPRYVTTHKIGEKYEAHIAVEAWCGNTFTGSKKFTFLDAPPENKLLCARCEEMAQRAGLPSSETIAGRHVHVGRLFVKQICCT